MITTTDILYQLANFALVASMLLVIPVLLLIVGRRRKAQLRKQESEPVERINRTCISCDSSNLERGARTRGNSNVLWRNTPSIFSLKILKPIIEYSCLECGLIQSFVTRESQD